MNDPLTLPELIKKARLALQAGDRRNARQALHQAVSMDPGNKEAWMYLAAISGPQASISYLNRVLALDPANEAARKGMHWAIKRYRAQPKAAGIAQPMQLAGAFAGAGSLPLSAPRPAPVPRQPRRRPRQSSSVSTVAVWMLAALILVVTVASAGMYFTGGLAAWFGVPQIAAAWDDDVIKPSLTPTATATFTPTPTFTPTLTPTATPTFTPTPTETPLPTDTPVPPPTDTPIPQPVSGGPGNVVLPPGVSENDRWIDVDLTNQMTYAYEGYTLVNSFLVSTGTWRTPTVTGVYRVYVKYVSTPMSGPGYYLPDVPYTMYFYQGYALHGTYWHNNFGTPMSHGCVNLYTPDAEWLFNFASVGTVVNVHY